MTPFDRFMSLRESGKSALEIAVELGVPGSDAAKKRKVNTTFEVLRRAGVQLPEGRGIGQRGRDATKRAARR